MNKNQVKGSSNEIKGKIRETAGKITGNKTTQAKGVVQKTAGKAEKKIGDMREDAKKSKSPNKR